MGRPSILTDELAEAICVRLANGEALIGICRDPEMPARSTVRKWVDDDTQGFSAKYARAREMGYELMAEELLEISDDGSNDWMERRSQSGSVEIVLNSEHVTRSRLRVDSRKWLLSKMLPKVYGEKIQHTGADDKPLFPAVTVLFEPDKGTAQG